MRCIWTALVVGAVLLPQIRAEEREVFSGAALLYTYPEITIVYPAGPGEEREVNRISAERRADYLTGRHRTITRVLADVDMTDEDRKAHLLLLGWNNALLRETGVVELTDRGWRFEGIERGYEHDLLFGWISPFSEDHELFFWSRINPELDRYLVLPFFGSDWIVYDRYTVEQYGRFRTETMEWPPRRDTRVEVDNRGARPWSNHKGESEHYVLHDFSLGLTEAEIEAVLQARESAWAASVAALGKAPENPVKIKLYVYEDSVSKQTLCDVHDARHHLPQRAELHTTRAIALDPGLHEDIHVIARQLYGPGYLTLLVEGLAVWAEQQQGTNELPVYAAMLSEGGELPGLGDLLNEERMRVLNKSRLGFPIAGLFVAWLLGDLGPDAIERVYGQYDSDPVKFATALDLSVEEIETRFAAFVRRQAAKGDTQAQFREATARAQHFGGLGDYERAVPALERALELRPDHLFTRYGLAVARLKLEQLEAAEAELTRILEIHREEPSDQMALLAWYQLGELYAKKGLTDKAKEAYGQVLALPDYRGMHGRAREARDELGENP